MIDKLTRLDILYEIGTPDAAVELAQLIWSTDDLAYHAAWRLASMLANGGVEEALQKLDLTQEQKWCKQIRWVWDPFVLNTSLPISTITGRLAYLLDSTPVELLPHLNCFKPDFRLVIPLCTIVAENTKLNLVHLDHLSMENSKISDFNNQVIEALSENPIWRQLMYTLTSDLCFQLLNRLARKPAKYNENNQRNQFQMLGEFWDISVSPDERDWHNLFQEVEYQFTTSWHVKILKGLLVLVLLLGLWQQVWVVINSAKYFSWINSIIAICGATNIFGIWYLLSRYINSDMASIVLLPFTMGAFVIVDGNPMLLFFSNAILGPAARAIQYVIFGTTIIGIFVAIIIKIFIAIGGIIFGAIVVVLVGSMVIAIIFAITDNIVKKTIYMISVTISVTIGAAIAIEIVFWATTLLLTRWSMPVVIGLWLVWCLLYGGLLIHAKRQEQLAQNPLHGLLDQHGQAASSRRRGRLSRLNRWPLLRWFR